MQDWQIVSGSAIGNSHLATGRNSQDAVATATLDYALIGFLADGCSASLHSEVFAKLAVEFLTRRTRKLLHFVKRSILPTVLFRDLINFLDASLSAQGLNDDISRQNFLETYCLFTVMGIIITPKTSLLLTCGDGVVIINDAEISLDQNNTPTYPAYALHQTVIDKFPEAVPHGFTVWELKTNSLNRLGITSDAFNQRPDLLTDLASVTKSSTKLQMALNRWTILQQLLDDDASLILATKLEVHDESASLPK